LLTDRQTDDRLNFLEDKIEYISGDISNINLNCKADLVISISVFEHIKNYEGTILGVYNCLNEGGLVFSRIDLRDHYNFDSPFLFYKYSNKVWEKYLVKEGVSYTNRLRHSDWIQLFSNYFELLDQKLWRYNLDIPRKKIKLNTVSEKDLDIGVVEYLMKKKVKA